MQRFSFLTLEGLIKDKNVKIFGLLINAEKEMDYPTQSSSYPSLCRISAQLASYTGITAQGTGQDNTVIWPLPSRNT